jgi:hypothetical protein
MLFRRNTEIHLIEDARRETLAARRLPAAANARST